MTSSAPHLADEHMNLYEWSGGVATFGVAAESRHPRRWHASNGTLAVLASLLILNGCASLSSAEKTAPPADNASASPAPATPAP